MLELRHIALVAVIALQLIEHLHEHLQHGCFVGATDAVVLLIDVEQQAARWNRGGFLQIRAQDLVVDFGQQYLCRPLVFNLLLAVEHQRKHLQQV